MNPAIFSPFPHFLLPAPCPSSTCFFCAGVSAVFNKVWIKMETGKVKRQMGKKCLTTEGWWQEVGMQCAFPAQFQPQKTLWGQTIRSISCHGKHFGSKQHCSEQRGVSLLHVLFYFSAATPGGYTIQADSGSCLRRAEILQRCCTECVDNWLATKNVCRSAHCDAHYMLLLAHGTVPYYHTWQMGSHNSL